jgi:hypothetical protein
MSSPAGTPAAGRGGFANGKHPAGGRHLCTEQPEKILGDGAGYWPRRWSDLKADEHRFLARDNGVVDEVERQRW